MLKFIAVIALSLFLAKKKRAMRREETPPLSPPPPQCATCFGYSVRAEVREDFRQSMCIDGKRVNAVFRFITVAEICRDCGDTVSEETLYERLPHNEASFVRFKESILRPNPKNTVAEDDPY